MNDRPLRKHPEVLAAYLDLPGRRALDVGCGDGALVRLLRRQGAWAVGLDPQAGELPAEGETVPLVRGLGQSLPFGDGAFDLVVFFNALHHVPAPLMRPALDESLRVLRPGGLLAVVEPVAAGAYFELMRPVEDETEVRAQALDALASLDAADGARRLARQDYDVPLAFADFAEWEARMIAVDPARRPALAAQREALQAGFVQAAERADDGPYRFRQPAYLAVFERA